MHAALVHLRHARTGGTERYLNQLAAHLVEAGHEVTVVCRSHQEPPHPAVRFVVLRGTAVGAAWRTWRFARDVERHLAGARYDVVLGLGRTWTQDVLRLGGGTHASYLEQAHTATLAPWERALRKGTLKQAVALAIERRALRPGACCRVIANSHMVRADVLERYGLAPAEVAVVYNGVDLERFHPRLREGPGADLRRELGLQPGQLLVLFLGSGYGRKGLDEVLEAFALFAPARPEARLAVVGYDSARRRYERRARRLGIAQRARFLGGRPDAEVCFAAADLYVLPTLYDPFANATLEALACGVPVITSRTNGASELITHGLDGSVLPKARSAGSLAQELLLWSEPGRVARARPQARALAERHGAARAAAESLAILAECAARKGAGVRAGAVNAERR